MLLVGNRTNQNGTDSWKLFAEGARFIHLDIDPVEIGRNYEALRLVGDAQARRSRRCGGAAAAGPRRAREAARPALEAAIAAGRAAHGRGRAGVLASDARADPAGAADGRARPAC